LGFLSTFSALIVTPRVDAFCPTNGIKCAFGGVGQTHKDITVGSIKELDQEFFSTSKLTKGMKKAIEEMANANGLVDKDQHTAAKHFDGETFAAGLVELPGDTVQLYLRDPGGNLLEVNALGVSRLPDSMRAELVRLADVYPQSDENLRGRLPPADG